MLCTHQRGALLNLGILVTIRAGAIEHNTLHQLLDTQLGSCVQLIQMLAAQLPSGWKGHSKLLEG